MLRADHGDVDIRPLTLPVGDWYAVRQDGQIRERRLSAQGGSARASAEVPAKRAKDLACPVCKTYQWNVTGIVDLDAGHLGDDDLGSIVLPVIVTVCEHCSYVRQFAWGAVRDATEHG
jgi:hypothetical protein